MALVRGLDVRGWFVALCSGCIIWLYKKNPALLAERYRRPGTGGQSDADTLIAYGLAVGFVAWIVIPPLGAVRFGWTPRPWRWLEPLGGVPLMVSAFLFFRSFTDNNVPRSLALLLDPSRSNCWCASSRATKSIASEFATA